MFLFQHKIINKELKSFLNQSPKPIRFSQCCKVSTISSRNGSIVFISRLLSCKWPNPTGASTDMDLEENTAASLLRSGWYTEAIHMVRLDILQDLQILGDSKGFHTLHQGWKIIRIFIPFAHFFAEMHSFLFLNKSDLWVSLLKFTLLLMETWKRLLIEMALNIIFWFW